MIASAQRPPGEAGAGEGTSFGDECTFPSRAESKNQPSFCPAALAWLAKMQSDLLAESLEFAAAYALAALRAIREGDHESAIESFRFFDAAARTSRRCAEELRATVSAAYGGSP